MSLSLMFKHLFEKLRVETSDCHVPAVSLKSSCLASREVEAVHRQRHQKSDLVGKCPCMCRGNLLCCKKRAT